MNKFVTENLMLLEFLVDGIYFTPLTKKKIDSVHGETNVMFQFLDNKPIIITSEDLYASCSGKDKRSGKSCLFSMSTEQGIEALGNFLIKMKIFQKFPPGVLPNVIDIACGDICISELFQDLMESAMGSEEKAWVKCQKESVKMYMCGECVGTVSVFVRMSCYGKYIVTQCEMNIGDFQNEMNKQKTCQSDILEQQTKSKCLPLLDKLVPTAQNTNKKKPKEIPRQMGEMICDKDLCNMITYMSKASDLENEHKGHFLDSGIGAKDMAFKMLEPPPIKDCVDTAYTKIDENPVKETFFQMPNYTAMTKSQYLPSNPYPLEIQPCDPCPATSIVGVVEKEMVARPREKKVVFKKPSKDKILFRLKMPKYGPDDPCCANPYEFEFVTPAGWPRETLGKQCRDGQCDCKDFPRGYLVEYYGEKQLAELLRNQMTEEIRREKVYGICPVGQFSKVKRPKKGGIAALYYKCLGVENLMNKHGKSGGGRAKVKKEKTVKKKTSKVKTNDGEGKKKSKKKAKKIVKKTAKKVGKKKSKKKTRKSTQSIEKVVIEKEKPKEKPKKTFFRPKRKLQSHAGITVPDRKGPPCEPCKTYEPCLPCGPCGGVPCPGLRPYSPCGPCRGPCANRPCTARPCSARPCSARPCSEPCSGAQFSINQSSCPSCYRN